ncbi:MAG TPA: cell division protein ZapA [Spirochaetota bacterium]|nr:cell division protein ZapA [Spirochaetota bacterium]HOD16940.1 cell division protein ZapA [Spirochaetota bacterium]HPG51184.1 cell division protein ZapA [Spirochaetota bacterium]HQL83493.1 cell division protein ZapA [Spirochaetota bacterium]
MEDNRVKVSIYGQAYTINGDAPRDYILQLADYLNRKMEEVSAHSPDVNPTQVAILAALNVADEYFQLKKLKTGVDTEVERRTMALISMLDEGLIGDIFSKIPPAGGKSALPSEQGCPAGRF